MNTLIEKKLNNICERINNEIIYVNYGGCGIIAERLYCFLKLHNINCKIVVFSSDTELIQHELKNGINPKNGNNSFNRAHVLIKLENNLYIDSYGIEEKNQKIGYYYTETEIPFKHLVWWNLDTSIWNSTFCREQIPNIDKILFTM